MITISENKIDNDNPFFIYRTYHFYYVVDLSMWAKTLKRDKIIYRISTIALALFILPGIFFINSPMAIEGVVHLWIPEWLRREVGIGSFIGGLILLLPIKWRRIREWGYVGLGIVYLSALIAHLSVDWLAPMSFSPLVTFAILLISYIFYHRILQQKKH